MFKYVITISVIYQLTHSSLTLSMSCSITRAKTRRSWKTISLGRQSKSYLSTVCRSLADLTSPTCNHLLCTS